MTYQKSYKNFKNTKHIVIKEHFIALKPHFILVYDFNYKLYLD